ncbi:hypothetical protein Vi05172_g2247 [Venturia inaequalis]|nr:hypothetical protein Vi05172_g2247 [Venturia inaequalis]
MIGRAVGIPKKYLIILHKAYEHKSPIARRVKASTKNLAIVIFAVIGARETIMDP